MNPTPFKSSYVRRQTGTRGSEIRAGSIYKVEEWMDHSYFKILVETGDFWVCNVDYWEDYSFEGNLKNILEE